MSLRPAALAAALLVLAGCGSVGNVVKKTGQVLMDPSIPVGPAGDQPTHYTLSLYAGSDVNPNPNSAQPEPEPTAEGERDEQGIYVVNMRSDTRKELAAKLMAVLERIRQEEPTVKFPPIMGADDQPTATLGDAPYPMTSAHGAPALGQYSAGNDITPTAQEKPPAPEDIATPIAFKILQLKDDSLFLSADLSELDAHFKETLGSTFLRADDYILLPGQFKFIPPEELDEDTRYLAVMASFYNQEGATWKRVLRVDPLGRTYAVLVTLHGNRVTLQDEDSHRWQEPSRKP